MGLGYSSQEVAFGELSWLALIYARSRKKDSLRVQVPDNHLFP